MNAADHWQEIYATRSPEEVGWYKPDPITSRRLIGHAVARGARSIIDIGGGASSLVDHLLDLDVERVAVLDISDAGLDIARRRLGERADRVGWIVGDVTQASSPRSPRMARSDAAVSRSGGTTPTSSQPSADRAFTWRTASASLTPRRVGSSSVSSTRRFAGSITTVGRAGQG